MLGAIAQFERELIRERMLVGIAKAKAEGKYRGRAPTARMQAEKVRQLKAAGVGPSEIARQLGIGRTSVFRIFDRRIASVGESPGKVVDRGFPAVIAGNDHRAIPIAQPQGRRGRVAPSVWPMSLARHRPSCELCILLCTASSDHGACLPSGAS
jgi:Resolvase, N terminal domain